MFFHGIPRDNARTMVIFEIVKKIYDILSGGEIVFSSEKRNEKKLYIFAAFVCVYFFKIQEDCFFWGNLLL